MVYAMVTETSKVNVVGQEIISVPNDATPTSCAKWVIDHLKDQTDSDSFYMLSLSVVMAQWRKWNMLLPKVHPFYAVKANPDPVLLRLMAALGANFDCASVGEIDLVRSLNVNPERIIFANTCKPANAIIHARKIGVNIMTVDNELELEKIQTHFKDARLVIRIQIGDPTALVKLSSKFGVEPVKAAPALLKKAHSMGMHLAGISFHVGGGCRDASIYTKAIEHARNLFDLAESLGQHMTLLDIGGGYPGFCSSDVSLYKISVSVNAAIKKFFSDWLNFNAIAEPGRYFAMPSATLCSNVYAKRSCSPQEIIDDESKDDEANKDVENGRMYYITDGVFNSFNCVPVYDIRPPFEIVGKDKSKGRQYSSRIWGQTCDSADVLYKCMMLPEIEIGDWLMFTYMGAYTSCISSNFNGMPCGKVHYLVIDSDRTEVMALLRKGARTGILDSIGRPTDLLVDVTDGLMDDEAMTSDDSGCGASPVSGIGTLPATSPNKSLALDKRQAFRRRYVSYAL